MVMAPVPFPHLTLMFLLRVRSGKSAHNPAQYFHHFCVTIAGNGARLAMIRSHHGKTAIT
jgi:hypothetical protein